MDASERAEAGEPKHAPTLPIKRLPTFRPERFAWLPIFCFCLAIGMLAFLRLQAVWNPPLLLSVLNIIFLTCISFLVSLLAARSFLAGQSPAVLLLGCGTLALALASALASLPLIDLTPNRRVTIYNTGACLAGVCHLAGALWAFSVGGSKPRYGRSLLVWLYLTVIAILASLALATHHNLLPIFFIEGEGATFWNLLILWTAAGLFAFSAILLLISRDEGTDAFRLWYALGLGLIAVGLVGVSVQARLGDSLNWAGRTSQYLGGVYMLIAVIVSIRRTGTWLLPLEQALRESERRYQSLVDLSPDAILVHADGRYVFANRAAARLLGARSPEDIIGMDALELIHPDHRQSAAQRIAQAYGGMVTPLRETTFIRLDGQPVEVEVTGSKVGFGGRPAIQIAVRDITERKQAEAALREERGFASAVLNTIGALVIVLDPAGKIVRFNRACEQATQYEASEVLGKPFADLFVPPEEAEGVMTAFHQLTAGQFPIHHENDWLARDGGRRRIAWSNTCVVDEKGEVRFVIGTGIDITERKRAEEQLRELSQRLTYHVDNSPLAVIEWGPEMRLIRWSRAAERMFGWTAEEVLGKRMEDFRWICVEDEGQVAAVSTVLKDGPDPQRFSANRNYRKDGVVVDCEWYNSSLLDESGNLRSILSLVLDVTERKRLEKELRRAHDELEIRVAKRTAQLVKVNEALATEIVERKRSEEAVQKERQRLHDVLDMLPLYVLLLDRDYHVTFINRWFRERFGEAGGRRCFEWLFERTEPCETCETYRVLKTNASHHWEWTGPDGRNYDVFDFPFTDTDGSSLIMEVGIDITELKQAQERIDRANAMLQMVFDGISDPLLMIDQDLAIRMLNEATCRYFGLSRREDAIGKTCYELARERCEPCAQCAVKSGLPRGDQVSFERKGLFDPERIEQVTVYPVDEVTSGVSGVIMHIDDITDSKNMEKHLTRADRLSSLGQLSGGIAHEIRNPLAGISLFIDVLSDEDRYSRTAQEQDIFTEIKLNIKKIDGIIKRVLDFARQSETTTLTHVQMGTLLDDSLKLWQSRMVKVGIQSALLVEDSLTEVLGDSIEIQQVLTNLIQNAIEAMEKGGTLTVSAKNGALSFDRKRRAVVIEVRDTGSGIPLEQQKSIFNPFFTTKHTGTGLGLAISHRIVSRHGGLISFESVPEMGTTFMVELPAAPER